MDPSIPVNKMNDDYFSTPRGNYQRSISPLLFIIGLLLASILGGIFGAGIVTIAAEKNQQTLPVETSTPGPTSVDVISQEIEVEISTAITEAVEKVAPSVVTVISHLPARRSFFGGTYEQTSSGSGAIISPDGYIITNYHVVEDAESLEVVLADGTTLPTQLIGVDPYGDLAVIQAEGEMPGVASWGNSDQLKAGETVIAIGSPLGAFKNTVTVGVVSATGRSIETDQQFQLEGLIQTDAAINQGNSGGPLVNLMGQVVGINTLIVRGNSSSGTVAEGLGFAVPSNVSRTVAEKLIAKGYIARPALGANWGWITPEIAARYRLPVEYGVYITEIESDGPADQAGLQRGDILTAIEGEVFNDDHPFTNLLFQYEPGEKVTFSVVRDGEQMEVEVELGEQ
jgi:serine protease Do